MGSPADDLDAVLEVLKSRGLEADVVGVGPVTVHLRRSFSGVPAVGETLADAKARAERMKGAELAEFERVLMGSSRAPV